MASTTSLNAKNLERLGAARLAELLMELADGDAAMKRRLRLELAGTQSARQVAKEVRKRLTTIARSRSFVDWRKRRAFVEDLDLQRRAIAEQIAPADPAEALELMWRFLGLAPNVHERTDDSDGLIGAVFRDALKDLGTIAANAQPDPITLADRVYEALNAPEYGQHDGLIATLGPTLGSTGLEHLKARIHALAETPVERPPQGERRVIARGPAGTLYADDLEERRRQATVTSALREIADAQGDVDAFIALHGEESRKVPAFAADIGRRLLAAGRADEALATVNEATTTRIHGHAWELEAIRVEALDQLGRHDEAQQRRWARFVDGLDAEYLRAYLRRLPDFEDIDAEEQALDHAEKHTSIHMAISFLLNWRAHARAARIVIDRRTELDGNAFPVLTPAAETLAEDNPLAVTVLLRAMIDFCLENAKTTRYRHAARHLNECAQLAERITDFGDIQDHASYLAQIKARHGRKSSFWRHVKESGAPSGVP